MSRTVYEKRILPVGSLTRFGCFTLSTPTFSWRVIVSLHVLPRSVEIFPEIGGEEPHLIEHIVPSEAVLHSGQVPFVQRLDPFTHRNGRIPHKEHQLPEAGVDVSLRRYLAGDRCEQIPDHVGGMPEVGEGRAFLIDRRRRRMPHLMARLDCAFGQGVTTRDWSTMEKVAAALDRA